MGVVIRKLFNPNSTSSWFKSVVAIINQISLLTVVLTGAAVIRERRITDLVLGYPYNMDGTAGFKAKEVDAFAARLKAEFALPVHLVDERLTSYEAESTIGKAQRRQVRASGIVDSRAATLILQDFLDQRVPLPPPEAAS